MQTENTITQLIDEKQAFVRLSIVAIVLAISIGIASSLIATRLQFWSIWIFAGIASLSIAYFALGLVKRLSFDESFSATVFFQPSTNRLLRVKGYAFSKDVSRVLDAVEAENKSIFSDWVKEPLSLPRKKTRPHGKTGEEKEYIAITRVAADDAGVELRPKSAELLEEIAQFCLLESLSTHLSGHFDHSESGSIEELRRKDIPEVLQSNRVLNLLTTPIEQRDIFIEAFPDSENRPTGEIYSVWSSDGAMYSRFDLMLPKGSKVTNPESQTIRIETSRFIVDIRAHYSGMSTVVPRAFEQAYIGIDSNDLDTKYLNLRIKGQIKPLAIFSSKGWDDFKWLDSFREQIKSDYLFDDFLKRINWDAIEALLHCQRKRPNPTQDHA